MASKGITTLAVVILVVISAIGAYALWTYPPGRGELPGRFHCRLRRYKTALHCARIGQPSPSHNYSPKRNSRLAGFYTLRQQHAVEPYCYPRWNDNLRQRLDDATALVLVPAWFMTDIKHVKDIRQENLKQ